MQVKQLFIAAYCVSTFNLIPKPLERGLGYNKFFVIFTNESFHSIITLLPRTFSGVCTYFVKTFTLFVVVKENHPL